MLRFEHGQIANAAFVGPAAVIDHENRARLRGLHGFQENIDAAVMSDWDDRPGETFFRDERSKTRRSDADPNL